MSQTDIVSTAKPKLYNIHFVMISFSSKEWLNSEYKKYMEREAVKQKQTKKSGKKEQYQLDEVNDKFLLRGIPDDYMNSEIVKCGNEHCREVKRRCYNTDPVVVEEVVNITGEACKELCKITYQPQKTKRIKVDNYANKVNKKLIEQKREELKRLENYCDHLKAILKNNKNLETQLESIKNKKSSEFDLDNEDEDENNDENSVANNLTPNILNKQVEQILDNINIMLREKMELYIKLSKRIKTYNELKPQINDNFNKLVGIDPNFNLKEHLK